jgi:ribulose-5-phosphate 4-epimerase/fuculose-1-phosphate aldolase
MGQQGYGDEGGAGHISVRDPILANHFWINPFFRSFKYIKVSDLVLVNEEGEVVKGGNMHAINAAGFMIHSAIHQARPDVIAACHAHSIAGKAFSTLGIELDISTQDACAFWHDHTVYKYSPYTTELIGIGVMALFLVKTKEIELHRKLAIIMLLFFKIMVF